MEVAFISGINYPEFVEEGTIAFTLCDWIKDNPDYVEYYSKSKQYKITDNMAAENGISSPIDQVLEAARKVNADEIWASDKLYDKDETLKLTREFIDYLTDEDKKRFKIVGLPQGKNHKDFVECYVAMLEMPEIDIIALSKYSCPEAFEEIAGTKQIGKARPVAVKWLHERGLLQKPIHLAGGDNFFIEEIIKMKDYPIVRSIDSNICFKLGVMGHKIDSCEVEPEERLNHKIDNLTEEQLNLIRYNIEKVKEVLK